MKIRRLKWFISFTSILLGGAITMAYAFTSPDAQTPITPRLKNDVVFNWGLSS